MPIILRTPAEMDRIAEAGRVLSDILLRGAAACQPGNVSSDIGDLISRAVSAADAEPLLASQPGGGRLFGHAACICINEEVVHSPPRARILRPGDIVTIDVALRFPKGELGWCVDAATSLIVPGTGPLQDSPSPRARTLIDAASRVASAARSACFPGEHWSAAARAANQTARDLGVHIGTKFCGHGTGRTLHEQPRVGFAGEPDADFVLRPGMVFTIEPVVIEGLEPAATLTLDDGWTVITADRRWAAYQEVTVGITKCGPRLLAGVIDPL